MAGDVPRMNAHTIGECRIECRRGGIDDCIGGVGIVGVVIAYHGTGSYPLPPHGLQRHIRFTASHPPLTGPCLIIASIAYWLQVGVKRHDGGVKGEMQVR